MKRVLEGEGVEGRFRPRKRPKVPFSSYFGGSPKSNFCAVQQSNDSFPIVGPTEKNVRLDKIYGDKMFSL